MTSPLAQNPLNEKDLHQAVKDSRDTMQFLNEQNLTTTKAASPKNAALSVPIIAGGVVFIFIIVIFIVVRKNSHA